MLRVVLLGFLCSLAASASITYSGTVSSSTSDTSPNAEFQTYVDKLRAELQNIAVKDTPAAEGLKPIIAVVHDSSKTLTDAEVQENIAKAIELTESFNNEVDKLKAAAEYVLAELEGQSGENIDEIKAAAQTIKDQATAIQAGLDSKITALQGATTQDDLKNILNSQGLDATMTAVETFLISSNEILDKISSPTDQVQDKINAGLQDLKDKVEQIKQASTDLTAKIQELKAQVTSNISPEKLAELKSTLDGLIEELKTKISATKEEAAKLIESLPKSLIDGVNTAINDAKHVAEAVIAKSDSASNFLTTLQTKIAGATSSIDLKAKLSSVINGLKGFVKDVLASTKTLLTNAIDNITAYLASILTGTQAILNSVIGDLGEYATGLFGTSSQIIYP